jgi:S1-C subfamily serine protease
VNAHFTVMSGARTGLRFTPAAAGFMAGRHADAQLRFDPDADLSVSSRHAEFTRTADVWFVRDLRSLNGTFVNGSLIAEPVALHDGDTIMFGANGPRVRYECAATTGGAVREDTTVRVRAAVVREVRRFKAAAAGLTLLLLVLVAALATAITLVLGDRRERAGIDAERQQFAVRIDSMLSAGRQAEAALHGEVVGLRNMLQESEARLRGLRSEIAVAPAARDDAASLERQLLAASSALRRQQLAASLDFPLIERLNRPAVVMIWVEYTDGERVSGTAFSVRPDATLITSGHLVAGREGTQRPHRIAVRFAGSAQVFPARVLATSPIADLAALKVDSVLGAVPTIHGLRSGVTALATGAPVALIGFPLGGQLDAHASGSVARPLLSAGIVVGRTDDRLDVQGLGAEGGSGSPIFDERGELVGVLYGGRTDGGVQVLAAVPVGAVRALLASLR